MQTRRRKRDDGTMIPWLFVDPILEKFAELRRRLPRPGRVGRDGPRDGDAPSHGEISKAIHDAFGMHIPGGAIGQRLRTHHHRKPEA